MKFSITIVVAVLSALSVTQAFVTPSTNNKGSLFGISTHSSYATTSSSLFSTEADEAKVETGAPDAASKAPVLNGKRVLPYKVLMAGVKGHVVAGVYAILSKDYARGSAGWESVEHIGVSTDIASSLETYLEEHGADKVAHVRALSFVVPNQAAMEQVAGEWKAEVTKAGGKAGLAEDDILTAIEQAIPYDDDDDEDDEDDEFLEMQAEALAAARGATGPQSTPSTEAETEDKEIISPFASTSDAASGNGALAFTAENVDKVLDEVRPYLISDGGNVSVQSVDEETKNVYLKLEGACGSCPSSTVTMQMGIERVLKENFADLNEVLQVEDEENAKPTELTLEAVEAEVNRIKPAIIAMGGVVRIVSVDPEDGEVTLEYRGANKVRQGLELAVLDLEFVNSVKFLMEP